MDSVSAWRPWAAAKSSHVAVPGDASAFRPKPSMPAQAKPVVIGRLKQRRDFLRLSAARRKSVTPGLILQAADMPSRRPGNCESDLRLGFTVSRKVGNAVARNRAKRRLRAAAAEVIATRAKPSTDYVLIGRRTTLDRPYKELVGDLETALRRLDALRGDNLNEGTAA